MEIETVKIPADNKRGFKIVNADDPRAKPTAITRDDINAMKKADLVELLEAHGLESPEGKVADLRQMAINTIFLEA